MDSQFILFVWTIYDGYGIASIYRKLRNLFLSLDELGTQQPSLSYLPKPSRSSSAYSGSRMIVDGSSSSVHVTPLRWSPLYDQPRLAAIITCLACSAMFWAWAFSFWISVVLLRRSHSSLNRLAVCLSSSTGWRELSPDARGGGRIIFVHGFSSSSAGGGGSSVCK